MIHETNSRVNAAVQEIQDRLDAQHAVDNERLIQAALERMPDFDEEESDPVTWPKWTDAFTWELDDEWQAWLARTTLED